MFWMTDDKGNCNFACNSWLGFTGQSHDEALGSGWTEAVHPDDRSTAHECLLEACRQQTEFMLHYRLRRHDGKYIWVISAASPSFVPLTHEFIGFLGTVSCYEEGAQGLIAKAEIGVFKPGQAMAKSGPVTKFDVIADHLIQAKIIAESCAPDVASAIDYTLHLTAQSMRADRSETISQRNVQ